MIRLQAMPMNTLDDARAALQKAVEVEFGTLPPYLYSLFSIPPEVNVAAATRIHSVVLEEMIHMCLACNMLNAIGGTPRITAPLYPGPLPNDIGHLILHLYPFSPAAMTQAMAIESADHPHEFPDLLAAAPETEEAGDSIADFYRKIDGLLAALPDSDWAADRNQIDDNQFFAGQLFPIRNYADARKAIFDIISEGEGSALGPLDFEGEMSHYYRFQEISRNQVLVRDSGSFAWGGPLGVDWALAYDAISDPGSHDFADEPEAARLAQAACDAAFTRMIAELQGAVEGKIGALGRAVRAMMDLRMAAHVAFTTPLNDGRVAGPSFKVIAPAGEPA